MLILREKTVFLQTDLCQSVNMIKWENRSVQRAKGRASRVESEDAETINVIHTKTSVMHS